MKQTKHCEAISKLYRRCETIKAHLDSSEMTLDEYADNMLKLSKVMRQIKALKEREPHTSKLTTKQQTLANLVFNYPTITRESKETDGTKYFNWADVKNARNPRLELEKLAVYLTVSRNGPDVDAKRIGRRLRGIRSHCYNNDILRAYEDNTLVEACISAGLLGPESDSLRHDGDRYYGC